MKVAGAYWRGDSNNPDADAHLRHGLGRPGAARRLSPHAGGGREARPPPARPRDGPVPFPGGGAGRRVLACQGLEDVPAPGQLHAPPPRRAGLSGGQRAAGARQEPVGDVRPLGLVPRQHVQGDRRRRRHRRRPRFRAEADELPRPCADLQAWAEVLSRSADKACGIRRGASLRAVRRAAWADARARLHAGRRAYLLHRGAAGGANA